MAGRFKIETVFKGIDQVTAPVRKMQKGIGKFARDTERKFRRLAFRVKKFAAGLRNVALVGVAAFAAVGFAMRDVINIGAEFKRALGAAAAKFPERIQRGTDAFKKLQETAREVGRTTEFTATQAAGGLNFLAKAGFKADFAMSALPRIIDFATASEIEFARAADIASDALGAFGFDSENLEKKMIGLNRTMDVMAATAMSANVSVEELFESVVKSAPVATAAGISIETYSATMGVLASNGIKATESGTAAKNMMLSLAGVGFKAAKTFKNLNIPLVGVNGELRDQFDVLDDLKGAYSKMTKQQQLASTEAIFGKRALASVSVLLGDSGKKLRGLRKELELSGGTSKRVAAFMRNDVKGSLDAMKSAIESVKLSLFEMNEGPLKKTIDFMTDWIRANEMLIATKISDFIDTVVAGFKYIIDNREGIISTFKSIADSMVVTAKAIGAVSDFVKNNSGIMKLFTPLVQRPSDEEFLAHLNRPQTVSPQERIARSVEERRTTSTAEVTLTAGAGTSAEVTGGTLGNGLELVQTGAF